MSLRPVILVLTTLVLVAGCGKGASDTSSSSQSTTSTGGTATPLTTGMWSSKTMQLTVTTSGATFELSCASGQVTVPITVDSAGYFNVTGTETSSLARPVGQATPVQVTLSGMVSGDTMNLTIATVGSGTTGSTTYTLTNGSTVPGFVRCL
jgi:uncharacterized membrane protein